MQVLLGIKIRLKGKVIAEDAQSAEDLVELDEVIGLCLDDEIL